MQIEILLGIREYEIDGGVVQLVRIHACHAWGREFEPRRSRQLNQRKTTGVDMIFLDFNNILD